MTTRKKYNLLLLFLFGLLINSCVEPYDFGTEDFEDVLVVQATLTDEWKYQEIKLTRTSRLNEENIPPETGASVRVYNEMGQEFLFMETDPGIYRSRFIFAINPETEYTLSIVTDEGKEYSSTPTRMITGNQIDRLYAERTTVEGEDGVALLVESENPDSASRFYRYEYEETYKIVSPFEVPNNIVPGDGDALYKIVPNTRNETVCYNTVPSNKIILSNTSSLTENTTGSFLVRFLNSSDPKIGHRYSILVKQFSLTPEAYSYFSTLEKISGSESVFSENQPGFIYGNIYSEADSSEKVIGFFSLSSVSTERSFFNYEDFYGITGDKPQFPEDCSIYRPGELIETPVALIFSGDSRYVGPGGAPSEEGRGPLRLIANECVDCTVYGTTEVPEFWEE